MGKKISVTFIGINYFPEPFGIAPYATGLCRGLANKGYCVNVVAGIPHYPEWKVPPEYRWKWTSYEIIDGVALKRVRHSVPRKASNSRRLLMEFTFGIRGALSKWSQPDVVICTTPALLSTAALCLRNRASLRRRPAFGVWVQDLYAVGLSETQKPGSTVAKLAGRLESWVLREADGVVVAHDRFREQLVQNLCVDPTKIRTIKNWTHIRSNAADDRKANRGRFGWSETETVVLHAGNMGVKQGLENVVHAAQIANKKKLNLRFVLVGDGNQRASLEAMARQTCCLEFRDPLPQGDFVAALRAADILLVNEKPGVSEMSIPSKLSSYFQSGTPVLASTNSLSNAANEIRNSKAGVVVESGDPVLLVEAAAFLGGNPDLRMQLGANGIEYAAAELSEKASLEKFDNWVKQLAAK